jgi:hypothetical protein
LNYDISRKTEGLTEGFPGQEIPPAVALLFCMWPGCYFIFSNPSKDNFLKEEFGNQVNEG